MGVFINVPSLGWWLSEGGISSLRVRSSPPLFIPKNLIKVGVPLRHHSGVCCVGKSMGVP